jgi:hypothetical protein
MNQNTVKLSGSLPAGELNGLRDHAALFLDDPAEIRLAIVAVDTKSTTEDLIKGEVSAALRVRRVELVVDDPADLKALKRLMLRASERRAGDTVLPLDTEQEIDALFEQFTMADPGLGGGKDDKDGDD